VCGGKGEVEHLFAVPGLRELDVGRRSEGPDDANAPSKLFKQGWGVRAEIGVVDVLPSY
jgi:hypothetical protein